jgi:cellulose synthase/poly-beta-1,6-N-acetylglucosamine synthase-like glycosyltransferase
MVMAGNWMLIGLTVAVCAPVAMFCLEVALSLVPRHRGAPARLPENAGVAVLIPAHNEEAVLGATLATLLPTMPTGGRVVVVADNCSDRTAEIARSFGAEAAERTDALKRGKGFALDFGIQYLAKDQHVGCISAAQCTTESPNPTEGAFRTAHAPYETPDVIVFLDADCRVGPDTVKLLAAAAIETGRPVQGLNLCDPDPNGSVLQLISGLAFRFKNLVRTLGLVRLAGMCHLTGTGMALPWNLAASAKLADGNVVEDMQLGINLALAGKPALFLPAARVDSPLPQQRAAARTQRTRWEHGHLKTLLTQVPRLLLLALRHRRLDLAWLALDLAVPPLALLAFGLAATTALTAASWLLGGSTTPLTISAIACAGLLLAVLAGWAAHCRRQVPLFALLAAPLYIAAKLPIYLAFIFKRQQAWVRTARS